MRANSEALFRETQRVKSSHRLSLAFLGFLTLTILGLWAWVYGGQRFYAQILVWSASWVYPLFGLGGIPLAAARLRYVNIVPFVALMLVTPGLSWKRRSVGILAGLLFLHFSHLALNATPRLIDIGREGLGPNTLSPIFMIVSDGLPFVLWAFFAPGFFVAARTKDRLAPSSL